MEKVKHLRKLVVTVRDSLKQRFLGIFIRMHMAYSEDPEDTPFHNQVYVAASVLDPNLKLAWIDQDGIDDYNIDEKDEIIQEIRCE